MSVGSIPTAGNLLKMNPQKLSNTDSAGFLCLDSVRLLFTCLDK